MLGGEKVKKKTSKGLRYIPGRLTLYDIYIAKNSERVKVNTLIQTKAESVEIRLTKEHNIYFAY